MATLSVPSIAPPTLVSEDSDSDDERGSQDSFSDAVQSLDVGVSSTASSSASPMLAPSIRPSSTSRTTSTSASREAAIDKDDDSPPAFPALNSAQRAGAVPSPALSSSALSAAQPSTSSKASTLRSILGVPPRPLQATGVGSGLMVPPSTSSLTAPPGVGGASGAKTSLSGGLGVPGAASSKRKKVVLEPGCSPLDWARLKSSTDLRGGVTSLQRIPPSELARHKTEDDAWSAFNGKVYNLTPYLRFHPGGVKEVMRVAGRDGTRLFMLTHSWVNIDAMIDSAMVGMLVAEPAER